MQDDLTRRDLLCATAGGLLATTACKTTRSESALADASAPTTGLESLRAQALLDVMRLRRSRRFASGITTTQGPLAFASQTGPRPLSEDEEAALVFAASGITGHVMGDLVYAEGQGGTMLATFLGRTIASADAVHAVSLMVLNDNATYLMKRPQDLTLDEIPDVIAMSQAGRYTDLYRACRVKVRDERRVPQAQPPYNLDCNKWDLYKPGVSYFLPVADFTFMYINGLLEYMSESMGVFFVDERRKFAPAGLGRFAKSRGGHLHDDPAAGRTLTIERAEAIAQAVVMVEEGMMLQNLGLMAQAMGLGGFPHFAGHEYAWFQALGFKMLNMPMLDYLGGRLLTSVIGSLLGANAPIPYPVALEVEGRPVLQAYCPPNYATMKDAVEAVVERKFGASGTYRGGAVNKAWKSPDAVNAQCKPPSAAVIAATTAYCQYIYDTYGRFPAYPPPFRTNVAFQASHLDQAFYETFYQPEALAETFKGHDATWHGG